MSSQSLLIFLKLTSIGGLVLANAFFVATEFSLVTVRRSRISILAENGNRNAITLLNILDHLNAAVSATQFGITLASLALGWIGEVTLFHLIEPMFLALIPPGLLSTVSISAFSITIAFALITFFHIVLGEIVPKSIALERAEAVALYAAYPLKIFYQIFKPLIWILNVSGSTVTRLIGVSGKDPHKQSYTEEEIRQLVSVSHQSGHLNQDERELIHNIFHFTSSVVREVMTPRPSIVGVTINSDAQDILKAFEESGYSRLIVYGQHAEEIIGIIHSKDFLPYLLQLKNFSLKKIIRPPCFIPETAHLEEALRQLRVAQTQLAIVVNEHGSVEGIITMEDLLEEIVGEIHDEHDVQADEVVFWKQSDGTILLDGSISIREANRKLDINLPESDNYTTLAGFLMTEAGKLLKAGDRIEYQNLTFIVEQIQGRRITRVRLHHIPIESDIKK